VLVILELPFHADATIDGSNAAKNGIPAPRMAIRVSQNLPEGRGFLNGAVRQATARRTRKKRLV
jgi:hypothetical protein